MTNKGLLIISWMLLLAAPNWPNRLHAAELLITGDVQGHFVSSESGDRPGALALISEPGNALKIDAGNLLFSRHLIDQPLSIILAAPEAMGYDLLHITWMDLVHGAEALQAGLEGLSYETISANLVNRSDGELLVAPYALFERNRRTVAVVGVTGLSDARLEQPEFDRVLSQVEILDPAAVLKALIPELRELADDIILLFAGDNASLFRLHAELGDQVDVFVAGYVPGLMNEPLPSGVANGRGTFGFRALKLERARAVRRGQSPWRQTALASRGTSEDPEIRSRLEAMGIRGAPALTAALGEQQAPLDQLPPESTAETRLSARSRAHALSVTRLARTSRLDGLDAPEGKEFLILDVRAENRKPGDLIFRDGGQEAILFGYLNEALVLLTESREVIPLPENHDSFPGALPFTFALPRPGTWREGRLIFHVPTDSWQGLELRHHHIEYEALQIPLIAPVESKSPAPGQGDWQENDFLAFSAGELSEVGLEPSDQAAGSVRRRVELVLRGSSRLMRANPAVHYRPDAPLDAEIQTGRVMPFPNAADHIMLVSEEGFVYPPRWDLGTISETPFFLPGVETSGRLVFDIPNSAESFRFSIYFPVLSTVTERRSDFPPPMHFTVDYGSFAYNTIDPVIDFELSTLRVLATALERSEEGIVVEIVILNDTDQPGFWPMERRLSLRVDDQSGVVYTDRLTDRYGFDQPWQAHLPAGEPRRMRLHFPTANGAGSGTLEVSGVDGYAEAPIRWTNDGVFYDVDR